MSFCLFASLLRRPIKLEVPLLLGRRLGLARVGRSCTVERADDRLSVGHRLRFPAAPAHSEKRDRPLAA